MEFRIADGGQRVSVNPAQVQYVAALDGVTCGIHVGHGDVLQVEGGFLQVSRKLGLVPPEHHDPPAKPAGHGGGAGHDGHDHGGGA